ncbi:lipid-transfer protein [Croceicoccus estronivorus]|uniref:thiolase C-terminal domain-containing protein n=1 Tax=Croceicoccus estronivorus TaxID=1172626 RepID=UPI0008354971|nr:lipid-transfer protein [Croceicoccus estronivorus]OCC25145.1 lipid-transfer protein [Croceicoccus estronivorus]
MTIAGKVAIAGIGQTQFGRGLAESERELAYMAIDMALKDAGIEPSEIDALSSYTMEATPDFEIVRNLGLGPLSYFSQAPHGGGAGPAAIGHAAMALATGQAKAAVVWRARKRSAAGTRVWAQSVPVLNDHWKWSRPSGLLRPVDEVAMIARRYAHQYGDIAPALAEIAVTLRRYACANPAATMYGKPMDEADYHASRMVADPLRLFDNCLETDGAVALVLLPATRARDARQPPVLIEAFAQGLVPGHQSMADFHRADALTGSSAVTAEHLWQRTAFTAADVDVAQFYDAFSPMILFSLEAYGFAPRGEGARMIVEGALRPDGALPTNTAGGGLSEAYLHGMNLATEAVRQLRGTATTQIADARLALVTGCDATPNGALLLRRDG